MKNDGHVTVEQTSKKLKLQLILSVLLLIVGVCWMFGSYAAVDSGISKEISTAPSVVCLVAVLWWIVTKIRIWWNHG